MAYEYSEDGLIERATQDVLEELGWQVTYAWHKETFGANSALGREHKGEVLLKKHVRTALKRYNPDLPETAYTQAIEQIEQREADKTLAKINLDKYALLTNGVEVAYTNAEGILEKKKLRVFDFEDYHNNDFLAVRQLEIVGDLYNRRPDVIGFVNGIPLVFFELKAHHANLRNAYTDNITDYKDTITPVFHCNAFILLSNGTDAKVGTITSPYKFFLEWKRIEENEAGIVSLDTILRGTCAKDKLMDIFENFLLYDDSDGEIVKLMAKNHQYIGVNKVLNQAKNIEDLKGKLGVFWHTQGSGKSYSMVFICQKIHRKLGGAYTFLIVADRSELERQLYDTFTGVGAISSNNKNAVAKDRTDLKKLLKENHPYVFTLIHKFSINPKEETEYPLITDRKNIIVISDEAHRTQAGTFARNMRFNAIPNASYLGFTGTPLIDAEEEITKNIFGDYVSVYDFKRAIDDGATLKLLYNNRGEKLDLKNPQLDEQMAEILENETLDDNQKRKLTYYFQRDYVILTAEERLDKIAKDLVWHFNERGYQGKAMFVTLDKPTAVRMYNLIVKHWQPYTEDLKKRIKNAEDTQAQQDLKRKLKKVEETEICVIVSPEQNEVDKFRKLDLDIAFHRKKMVDRDLEKEFKDEDNPFRLAIVCAMWITGFDVPCVSTIYLDKPIQGHTLMQTIARANRVYDDEKENGLIVDYGNVYKQLEKAYSVYGEGGSRGGGDKTSDDTSEENAKDKPVELLEQLGEELKESIRQLKAYLKELDFSLGDLSNKDTKPMERIAHIKRAADCVCLNEKTRAKFEVMAFEVFKKYNALYPEEQAKPHIRQFNAIEAIYNQLNQQVKEADVTSIIMQLQQIVNDSVLTDNKPHTTVKEQDVTIDLSSLDFDKLRAAFTKMSRKNTLVYDLQKAIEKKIAQMLKENPLRMEFYERYKTIIKEYNEGKTLDDTVKAFDTLTVLIQDLSVEDSRAIRENLSEETLAIYDLLREGKNLSTADIKQVKKVAVDTLEKVKAEKLRIEKWRESNQIRAQVRTLIFDNLQWLPQQIYADTEVVEKTNSVYQHIYTSYPGGLRSAYVRGS